MLQACRLLPPAVLLLIARQKGAACQCGCATLAASLAGRLLGWLRLEAIKLDVILVPLDRVQLRQSQAVGDFYFYFRPFGDNDQAEMTTKNKLIGQIVAISFSFFPVRFYFFAFCTPITWVRAIMHSVRKTGPIWLPSGPMCGFCLIGARELPLQLCLYCMPSLN